MIDEEYIIQAYCLGIYTWVFYSIKFILGVNDATNYDNGRISESIESVSGKPTIRQHSEPSDSVSPGCLASVTTDRETKTRTSSTATSPTSKRTRKQASRASSK